MHVWRSEDNLPESIFLFKHVGHRDGTQVERQAWQQLSLAPESSHWSPVGSFLCGPCVHMHVWRSPVNLWASYKLIVKSKLAYLNKWVTGHSQANPDCSVPRIVPTENLRTGRHGGFLQRAKLTKCLLPCSSHSVWILCAVSRQCHESLKLCW